MEVRVCGTFASDSSRRVLVSSDRRRLAHKKQSTLVQVSLHLACLPACCRVCCRVWCSIHRQAQGYRTRAALSVSTMTTARRSARQGAPTPIKLLLLGIVGIVAMQSSPIHAFAPPAISTRHLSRSASQQAQEAQPAQPDRPSTRLHFGSHTDLLPAPIYHFLQSNALRSRSSVVPPPLYTVLLSCLLPCFLGYTRREYAESYGYGLAVAINANWIIRAMRKADLPLASIAGMHASALLFYGVRLVFFLWHRENFVQHFRTLQQRRVDGLIAYPHRLRRTPLVLSCATLYATLVMPVLVTCQNKAICKTSLSRVLNPAHTLEVNTLLWSIAVSVAMTWTGFVVAALADLQKAWQKRKQADKLVTNGLYRFVRHPNYTFEILGWTGNFLCHFFTALAEPFSIPSILLVAASLMGTSGIILVLQSATYRLETLQGERYGDLDEYKKYKRRSWSGFETRTVKM
jgi:protein-S-isoprenylcysteine O-methyltransferase Ste14